MLSYARFKFVDAVAKQDSAFPATVSIRRGDVHWTLRANCEISALECLLRDPEGEIARQPALLRDGWLVTIARIAAAAGSNKSWLLRRINYGKPKAQLRDFFRAAAPIRAFRNALAFERNGFPTPRVIAAGIVRKFQRPIVGYLLVEELQPAWSLAEYLKIHRGMPHYAIQNISRLVAALHTRGFVHGDLTVGNVLLDTKMQPWLVDLERARSFARPVNWRGAVEEFFRFARHVPVLGPGARFGALRLLKLYCGERGWSGCEREFAADVLTRLKQKVKGYGQGQKA